MQIEKINKEELDDKKAAELLAADPLAALTEEAKFKDFDDILIKPHVEVLTNDLYDFEEKQFERNARQRSQLNGLYKVLFDLVTSVSFNFFIFLLIIGNTMTLAVYSYDQS